MIRDASHVAQRARHQRYHLNLQRAMRRLSPHVREMLDNVAIVFADEPTLEQRRESGLDRDDELFGLYQGIPRTERSSGYSMVVPDHISIFIGPLERAYRSRRALEEQIRITVLHELGHHLGLDEDGLEAIGLS